LESLVMTTSIRVGTLDLKYVGFVTILRHPCTSQLSVRQLDFSMLTFKSPHIT